MHDNDHDDGKTTWRGDAAARTATRRVCACLHAHVRRAVSLHPLSIVRTRVVVAIVAADTHEHTFRRRRPARTCPILKWN